MYSLGVNRRCVVLPDISIVCGRVVVSVGFLSVVHPSIFANNRDNEEAQLTVTVCYARFLGSVSGF